MQIEIPSHIGRYKYHMRLELSKTQATYEAENYNFLSDTEPR